MATGRITKRAVDAVPVPATGKREHLWDDTLKGFGLMVTDKGVRSYIVQYRVGGRGSPTRRVTIGKHGSPWTAEKARARAEELIEQVRRKVDPFDAQRAAVAEDKARKEREKAAAVVASRLGFSVFADRFVDKFAKVKQPRSWQDTESIVRRDLKPFFLDKPLPAITSADVGELLDKVHERGDAAAIKAYKALRSLFGYAVDKEKRHMSAATSPMLGVKPPAKIDMRQRTLNDTELRLVWIAAGAFGYPYTPLLRLMILTGQRLREVAEAPWTEFDLAAGNWLIPPERTKNRQPTLVPLSDGALEILRAMPKIQRKIDPATGKRPAPFLFTTTAETPVSGFSKAKARLDGLIAGVARKEAEEHGGDPMSVAGWRLHDLRRSFGNGLQRLGIKTEVIESALNHVSGTKSGVVGVYQTYKYGAEVRAAMEVWDHHVTALVANEPKGSNVVAMERRA